MTEHNEMRKQLTLAIAKIQAYGFGSVLSNIMYSSTVSEMGILLARCFNLLSNDCLQKYQEDSHSVFFEKKYLSFLDEYNIFINEIENAAKGVTLTDFKRWDQDASDIFEKIKFEESKKEDSPSPEETMEITDVF